MTDTRITRRTALLSAATLPIAGSVLATASTALADGHAKGAGPAPWSRFKLGDFELTVLLGGSRDLPKAQDIFGMETDAETFKKVSEQNFLPADRHQLDFCPVLVNTGSDLILFDTGLGDNGSLPQSMAAAGYKPEDVTVIILTHFHPDHIGGLMSGGKPAFPNARIIAGQVEYDFWTGDGAGAGPGKLTAANVVPLKDKTTLIGGGDTGISGITAVEAFGHTPGHLAFQLESGGEKLMLIGDAANHYVWSLGYPDWIVKFDMDKGAAASTRKNLLGMIADERMPFIGYHMPFPSLGYIERRGDDGFKWVAATYQLQL